MVQRRDVNPWAWNDDIGYTQAVEVTEPRRWLVFSGQTAIDADGNPPTTTDVREQVAIALVNLRTVLAAADMTMDDVVKLTVYTTDIDGLFPDWSPVSEPFAPNVPAATLVGVTRLVYPELKVEIEALAVQ